MREKVTPLAELMALWQVSRFECSPFGDWVVPPNYVRDAVAWDCCNVARVDIDDLTPAHWDALQRALRYFAWTSSDHYGEPPDETSRLKHALRNCIGFSMDKGRPRLVLSSIPERWSKNFPGRWEGRFAIAEFFDLARGQPSAFGKISQNTASRKQK